MKISLNEIKKFTNVDLSVEELVAKIGAQLGEVEEVVDLGKKYRGIVIAKVVSCAKHPNADKLSICKIDTGKEEVQVVCGAPNVREGLLVAWLPPGSTVPATFDKDPFVLEARELRGEMSNGMLASSHELGISDEHSGILELSEGKPGDDFAKIYGLDDFIIDIENKMFTHRPDLFGLLGIAREIAGIQGKAFKSPSWYLSDKVTGKHDDDKDTLKVVNYIPELVPRLMIQGMQNVQVKPSPLWLQIYLIKHGMKSINNIVDITNYQMHLTGQPLHAYDFDKLKGRIEVRKSNKGDKLKLLNGKEITFDDDSVVLITSGDKPIGIGGVMGGSETEVDSNTKNIALECATFDMYSIRRTSMKYGLFTDAVTRFSKGQSVLQTDKILAVSMNDIARETGGLPAITINDLKQDLSKPKTVQLSVEFINSRLGLELNTQKILELLSNVEFVVEAIRGDILIVKSPFWRTDIEIAEDVVEEVGRLYGYDHLPHDLPKRNIVPVGPDGLLKLKDKLRADLAVSGANEVLTYSFVHGNLLDKVGQDKKLAFKIANALSPDLQYYRMSLMPSLLDKVHANIKANMDQFAIFEIGKVHGKSEIDDQKLPKELERLALVFASKNKLNGAPYYQASALLGNIISSRFDGVRFETLENNKFTDHKMFSQLVAPFETARSAIIYAGQAPLGVVGEYKASVRAKFKLPTNTAGFELFLSPLLKPKFPTYWPTSKFPSLEQDITLKTAKDLSFASTLEELENSLRANGTNDVQIRVRCLDIFSNDDTTKNTTFRILFFSYARTLTTQITNQIIDSAIDKLNKKIKAQRV